MAISDELWIIAVGYLVTYLIIYKKNRLFGNIGFAGISLALLSNSTDNLPTTIGFILLLGSFISLIYDVLTPKK